MNCEAFEFVIKNPPTEPTLDKPDEGEKFYYSWNDGCYTPTFSWNQPDNWGWLGEKDTISQVYYLDAFNGETLVNSKRVETIKSSDFHCFREGDYTWKVMASPHTVNVSSKERHFSVCEVGKIGEFTNISPTGENEYDYVDVNFTLSWDKPSKGSNCVPDSNYSYLITIKKGNTVMNYTEQFNNPKLSIKDFGEGNYKWKVEAIGPMGVTSSSKEYKLKVCVNKKPGSPDNLKLSTTDIKCLEGDEDKGFYLSWKEPSKGEACAKTTQELTYRAEVCDTKNRICTNYTSKALGCTINVSCTSTDYKVFLYANNSYAESEPAVYDFSVCSRSKPNKPEVVSVTNDNYCSSKTEIKWTHNGWGSDCDTSDKVFNISYGDTSFFKNTSEVATATEGSYLIKETLAEGSWDISISACRILNSAYLCSDPGKGTVKASLIPQIIVSNITNDEEHITFSWTTDSRFAKCTNKGDFTYTLIYKDDKGEFNISNILVEDSVSINISLTYKTLYWHINLSSPNDWGVSTTPEHYSASNDCEVMEPEWPDNPLSKPENKDTIFDKVSFEWNGVDTFGVVCKQNKINETHYNYIRDNSQPSNYTVYVDDKELGVTSDTNLFKDTPWDYGEHTWYVKANYGNVTASTLPQTFCFANNPPAITSFCPQKPITDKKLFWTTESDCNKQLHTYISPLFHLFLSYFYLFIIFSWCNL